MDDVRFCWIDEVGEYECDEGDEWDGPAVFERESCKSFPEWTISALALFDTGLFVQGLCFVGSIDLSTLSCATMLRLADK